MARRLLCAWAWLAGLQTLELFKGGSHRGAGRLRRAAARLVAARRRGVAVFARFAFVVLACFAGGGVQLHAQADALARHIHFQHFHFHDLAGFDDFARVGHKAVGQLADVDEAIRQSMTERQFYDALKKKGYEIKVGKDISVRPPGKERFVRLSRNFGERYSPEGIREQILRQGRPARKDTDRGKASYPPKPKAKGFRALYYHYCYLLGIFPEKKPKDQNKRLHFLLREDLIKMEAISEEARLLARHQIDTAEQLSSYKESVVTRIETVTGERKTLYKKQRTAAVKSDEDALSQVRERIAALTAELKGLRKEVRLCDDIAVRSGVMTEKLNAIEAEEQAKGKETKRDERIRRRG